MNKWNEFEHCVEEKKIVFSFNRIMQHLRHLLNQSIVCLVLICLQ